MNDAPRITRSIPQVVDELDALGRMLEAVEPLIDARRPVSAKAVLANACVIVADLARDLELLQETEDAHV